MATTDSTEEHTRVEHDFTYHFPDGAQAANMAAMVLEFKSLAHRIIDNAPRNRNRSLALTKLEEARMHFNAAVAKGEQP